MLLGETPRVSEDDLLNQIERIESLQRRAAAYPRISDAYDWSLSRTKAFLEDRIEKIYEYRQATKGVFAEAERATRAVESALADLGYAPPAGGGAANGTHKPQYKSNAEKSFIESMQKVFGFDGRAARLMWKVYENLANRDRKRLEQLIALHGADKAREYYFPTADKILSSSWRRSNMTKSPGKSSRAPHRISRACCNRTA